MVVITTEKILKSISTDWKNLTRIQHDLQIKDSLDIKFLNLKLKEFERKKLIKCKDISGEKHYKYINDLQELEKKKEIFIKKSSPPKKKSIPKKKPALKKQLLSKKKTLENTNMINQIIKDARLKEYVKVHPEYLKTYPNYDLEFYSYTKLTLNKCNNCGRKFNSEIELRSHHCSFEVDLHNLSVKEAREKVKEILIKYNELGYNEIKLIHGYRRGHALRDYFRSIEFIREMKKFGFDIDIIPKTDPGTTEFIFRFISKK